MKDNWIMNWFIRTGKWLTTTIEFGLKNLNILWKYLSPKIQKVLSDWSTFFEDTFFTELYCEPELNTRFGHILIAMQIIFHILLDLMGMLAYFLYAMLWLLWLNREMILLIIFLSWLMSLIRKKQEEKEAKKRKRNQKKKKRWFLFPYSSRKDRVDCVLNLRDHPAHDPLSLEDEFSKIEKETFATLFLEDEFSKMKKEPFATLSLEDEFSKMKKEPFATLTLEAEFNKIKREEEKKKEKIFV